MISGTTRKPKGRKVVLMTLQELMNLVPEAEWVVRVPSMKMLLREAQVVLRDHSCPDTLVLVFDNGFVSYQRMGLVTVFPLHSCRDYSYKDAYGMMTEVDYQDFANQPWQIRVFMEGQDRLIHSQYNATMERKTRSYSAWEEDGEFASDEGAGDPLNILIRMEEPDEKELLWERVKNLTDRQQKILHECVVNGKKHYEVAEELGMSRQAVSENLSRSIYQLRKAFGVKHPVRQKQCFSSSRWKRDQKK